MQPKKTGQSSSGYPTQPQPTYGMQPASAPPSNPYYLAPTPGMPPPPPSYDQAMSHPVAPPNYIPNQMPMQHHVPMYPQPPLQPQQLPYYQQPHQIHVQQIPPNSTFVVPNAFDAGARFDSTSQVRIPPPPPGVAPNAAQMAHSGGHNVVAGQRTDRWVMGGSDGGATFW